MGTGTSTFIWYALCCAFIGFTVLVGVALYLYGARKNRQARARYLQEQREASDKARQDPE